MGRRAEVALTGLLVALGMGHVEAQRSPIRHGSLQIAGSAQFTHSRDIGNDRGWTVFEVTPRLGYFVVNGLALNANLRFRYSWEDGSHVTEWGVGPGLTYYVNLKSRHFYPFLSGRTLFAQDVPSADQFGITTKSTDCVWLASAGGLIMLGSHVGISGELFYQHEHLTAKTTGAPRVANNAETYGLQWGVAAFIF